MNILFLCHGNICRSPMAMGLLQKKLSEKKIGAQIDSAGFESFHIHEPPDKRVQKIMRDHGMDISHHKARLFSKKDYDDFDKIYVMDLSNYRNAMYFARNEDDKKKVDFILNVIHPGKNQTVPDPYYSGVEDCENVFHMLDKACDKIAESMEKGELK